MSAELIRFLKDMDWSFTSGLAATLIGITLLLSGCDGTITTPVTPTTTPSSLALDCPALGPTIPRAGCPGVRLENVTFTCAGTGKIPYSVTTTPGGAQRFVATLADNSVITATAIPIDGRCFDGFPVKIGITTGLVSIVLTRCFVTVPYRDLPATNKKFVDELACSKDIATQISDETPVLTLLGTRGVHADWNDRHQSKNHHGRLIIPAEDFVAENQIKTVFGLGGIYAQGTLFTLLVFARDIIDKAQIACLTPLVPLIAANTSHLVRHGKMFAEIGAFSRHQF